MITLDQAKAGLVKYIETDLMPHLTGFRRIGLGAYTVLAAQNITTVAQQYLQLPAVAVLGIADSENRIDVDKLYQAVVPGFANGEKVDINIPLIGNFAIDRSDIEKLYKYMKG